MKTQFRSVLAYGDSHVSGCELEKDNVSLINCFKGEISLEQADNVTKKWAWPQIIADQLEIPCYNFSLTGGSNARSLRKLTDTIRSYPDSLVLFGYTQYFRSEFYYPASGHIGQDSDGFLQVGIQWEYPTVKKFISRYRRRHPINDIFLKNFFYDYDDLNKVFLCVDSICRCYAKKFYHIPFFEKLTVADQNLLDLDGDDYVNDWYERKGFCQLPLGHYDHAAHRALAHHILEKLAVS